MERRLTSVQYSLTVGRPCHDSGIGGSVLDGYCNSKSRTINSPLYPLSENEYYRWNALE